MNRMAAADARPASPEPSSPIDLLRATLGMHSPRVDLWAVVHIQSATRRWQARTMHRALISALAAQRRLAASLLESERGFVSRLDRLAVAAATAAAPPAPQGNAKHHRDDPLLPAEAHAKLFGLLPALQETHRDLLGQLERRVGGRAHRGPLPLLLDAARSGRLSPLVAYAQLWATEGARALWQLERTPATAAVLVQLDGAGGKTEADGSVASADEGLRSLLELPLTRLEAYEDVATELGSVMLESAGVGTAELTELLLALDEMRQKISAALLPLGRLAPLWGVQARFKPGEVDELLDSPSRRLRHEGALQKQRAVGKLHRHYFLCSDAILTAEAVSAAGKLRATLSAHSGGGGGGGAHAELRKCKFLSLRGARVHVPLESEPTHFELHLAEAEPDDADAAAASAAESEAGKVSKLWAASAEEQQKWVDELSRAILELRHPNGTGHEKLPTKLGGAIDGWALGALRRACLCYGWHGEVLLGGAHAAVLTADMAHLRALLRRSPGAALATDPLCGATPLHLAVATAQAEAVALLLQAAEEAQAADYLERRDALGLTALYVAAICCAMPNPPPPPSASPHPADGAAAAAAPASAAIAPAVAPAAAGAAVGTAGGAARGLVPSTPVQRSASSVAAHAAASQEEDARRTALLEQLLRAGASAEAAPPPDDIDSSFDALACADLLTKPPPRELDSPLLLCVGAGKASAVAALLRHRADPRRETVGGGKMPALHLAVARGGEECVALLLRHGVGAMSLFQPQGLRRSPLHTAAAQQHPSASVIRLLLAHGAQPNQQSASGHRPLRLLRTAESEQFGQTGSLTRICEAVEALVLGGARPELRDNQGLNFEHWQPHPSVQLVAQQSKAKRKADKHVPQLRPSSSPLYNMVARQIEHVVWVADDDAMACMACGAPFSEMVRRHHCRVLGIVVCDHCSSKRAALPADGAAEEGLPRSSSLFGALTGRSGVRVCDAAFNMIKSLESGEGGAAASKPAVTAVGSAATAVTSAASAAPPQQRCGGAARGATTAPPARPESREDATRRELLGPSTTKRAASSGSSQRTRHQQAEARGAASAASEALDSLHERGEKLRNLDDKMSHLANEAEDFFANARKLRQQAEKNSKWLPF